MKLVREEIHSSVREGFQILLRADAELLLPEAGYPRLCNFYRTLAGECMNWAEARYGEDLRREFASLETVREKSRFGTRQFLFRMRVPWEGENCIAVVCETILGGWGIHPGEGVRRLAHVWDPEREWILPQSVVLRKIGFRISRRELPFLPDGLYPEGDRLVLFRNPDEKNAFLERKIFANTQETAARTVKKHK